MYDIKLKKTKQELWSRRDPELPWPGVPLRQMFETGCKISVTLIFDVLYCAI